MEYQVKSLDNMKMTIRCDVSSSHSNSLGKIRKMKHKRENWHCSPEQVTDSNSSFSDSHTTTTDGNQSVLCSEVLATAPSRCGRADTCLEQEETGMCVEQEKTGKHMEQEETGLHAEQQKTGMYTEQENTRNLDMEQEKTRNLDVEQKMGMSNTTAFVGFFRNRRRTFSDSHTNITNNGNQSVPCSEALATAPSLAFIKQEPAWDYEDQGSAQFSDCASNYHPALEEPKYTARAEVFHYFPDVTQSYQTRVKTETDHQSTVPDLQSSIPLPDLQSTLPDLQSAGPDLQSAIPDFKSTMTSSELELEASAVFDPKIVSVCSLAVPEHSQKWEAFGSAFKTQPVAEAVGVLPDESLPALVKTEPDLGFESESVGSGPDLGPVTENCEAESPLTVPMNYLQAERSRLSSLRQATTTSGFGHFRFDSEKRHFLHKLMGRLLETKQRGASLHLNSRREEVPNTRLAFQMNANPADEFMFKTEDMLRDNCAKGRPWRDKTDFDLGAHKPDLGSHEPYSSTSEPNISDDEMVMKNAPLSEEEDDERAEDQDVMSEGEEDEESEEEKEDLPVHFDPSSSSQTFSARCQQIAPPTFVATRVTRNSQQLLQGNAAQPRHVCGLCKAKFSSDLQCITHLKEQHMHCFRAMRGLGNLQPRITKTATSLPHNMAYRMKHDSRIQFYNRSGNLNHQMQPAAPVLNGTCGRADTYMEQDETDMYVEQENSGEHAELEETGLHAEQQKTDMHVEKERARNFVELEKTVMSNTTSFIRFIRNTQRAFPINTWQPDPGAARIPCKPLVNSIRIMADDNGKHRFFTCKSSDDSKTAKTVSGTVSSQNCSHADEIKQKTTSVCRCCRMKFLDGAEYLMHLQLNHGITDLYSCSSCQQCFINIDEHLKGDGMTHQIQKVRNICFHCNKSFPSTNILRGHMRCHMENRVFRCDRCDKVFTQAYTLALHRRTHFVPKELECPVCFKMFSWSTSLRFHMRKHTGERPFSCQTCHKSFTNSSNLSAHVRTHTGEKPFQCSTCLAAFTTSSALTVHKWQHTDAKPFSCDACDKNFTTSNSYKRHQAMHTGQRDYRCEDCGKNFTQSSSLNVHRRQHTGERPFFCTQCGASFMQSAHLTVHVRKHTGERPFVCKVCHSAFSRSEYLLRHCRMQHGAEASKPRVLGDRSERLCRQWMSNNPSVVK